MSSKVIRAWILENGRAEARTDSLTNQRDLSREAELHKARQGSAKKAKCRRRDWSRRAQERHHRREIAQRGLSVLAAAPGSRQGYLAELAVMPN